MKGGTLIPCIQLHMRRGGGRGGGSKGRGVEGVRGGTPHPPTVYSRSDTSLGRGSVRVSLRCGTPTLSWQVPRDCDDWFGPNDITGSVGTPGAPIVAYKSMRLSVVLAKGDGRAHFAIWAGGAFEIRDKRICSLFLER